MKHRLQRVEEAIKRELGELITRTMSFGGSLPTIHDVSISPDLRNCHVYIGVLGKKNTAEKVLEELTNARPMLQSALSKRVIIKYTPHLHFHLDSSVERGVRIIQLLDEIPPATDEEAAALGMPEATPEPVFDTDAEVLDPHDSTLDEDSSDEDDEDDLDDDDDEDPADEDDEDDANASAPARKPRKRPRQNRVALPEE